MFNKIKSFVQSKKKSLKLSAMVAALALSLPQVAHATEPTSNPLTLNFDVESMFTWTQTILNALMPVVYITLGISLGFLIIRALKSAFS